MFLNFLNKIKLVFKDKKLSKKIFFVLICLIIFRLFASIPIPGIDQNALRQFLDNNEFFGLLNIFSGGGLSGLSIVMLGVGPYITSSIIMQLLTIMSPKLKALYHENGEMGRKKFMQYSRLLTLPIAVIQAFGFLMLLQQQGIVAQLGTMALVTNIITITAGSMLLMWVGELISEFGIGNGVSLIIFSGIVAGLPTALRQILFSYDPAMIPTYVAFLFVGIAIILGVVVITESERPIPITYAKQIRGNRQYGGVSTYLPLRVNMAGVIPIIFALSVLLLPQMITNFLSASSNPTVQSVSEAINNFLTNQWFYGITYFVLVFLFTYFYTAVTFDPNSISQNLQKSGAFIPGVRPGESTSAHIANILTRITLVGASFLGVIAVLPIIVQNLSGITSLTIGGTALLIAVSVVIDLIKKIESQISMREY
ncbi:MAG TPA: preprotein translocase subunit SecY [Candidatus Paceibacterota bacterium]|nr:preprotein translocase subunit SecY [Candidatus Paceibacterota bacterium]HMP19180.1 preprotein translocase subunit SecY [Candidatus Paceibacterota bacterium]HMP85289.1 preprotein translocase subunit SecY [Candidatus Paceibacterota bacterium]